MKLCSLIDHAVQKNVDMANRKTGNCHVDSPIGVITTPIALHCCICWLSGGFYHDIRLTAGMSRASFYQYTHKGVLQQLINVILCPTNFHPHLVKLNVLHKISNLSAHME